MEQQIDFEEQFELISDESGVPTFIPYIPKVSEIDPSNHSLPSTSSRAPNIISNELISTPNPTRENAPFPSREELLAQETAFFAQTEDKTRDSTANCVEFFGTVQSLLNLQKLKQIESLNHIKHLVREKNHLINENAFLRHQLSALTSKKRKANPEAPSEPPVLRRIQRKHRAAGSKFPNNKCCQ